MGADITIAEGALIKSNCHAVGTTTGNLKINNAFLYAVEADAVHYGGADHKSGTITINNSNLFSPRKNAHALVLYEGNYNSRITSSNLTNGSTDKWSSFRDSTKHEAFGAFTDYSGGTCTVDGNTRICGGPYGAAPVSIYNGGDFNFSGESNVFASNEDRNCIRIFDQGSTIRFNSTGRFYTRGTYVAQTNAGISANYNVGKGHFASRQSEYMFFSNGQYLPAYIADGKSKTLYLFYLTNYNELKQVEVSNYFYYTKGV